MLQHTERPRPLIAPCSRQVAPAPPRALPTWSTSRALARSRINATLLNLCQDTPTHKSAADTLPAVTRAERPQDTCVQSSSGYLFGSLAPPLAQRQGAGQSGAGAEEGNTSRAIWMISSSETLPECLTCLTFLRSLGGSLSALRINVDAEGTTLTSATRFLHESITVTPIPL